MLRFFPLLLLLASYCGAPNEHSSATQESALQPIPAPQNTQDETEQNWQKAVGRVRDTRWDNNGELAPRTSAFHIRYKGRSLVLLAGHSFAKVKPGEEQPRLFIEWGLKENGNYWYSRVTRILEHEREIDANNDPIYDFAIVEVDYPPPHALEIDLEHQPKEGDVLVVYGHPHGGLQKRTEAVVTGFDLQNRPSAFLYRDLQGVTAPGSSGSAMISPQSRKVTGMLVGMSVAMSLSKIVELRQILEPVRAPLLRPRL